ncbi:MAG: hypothetical protein ACOCQT_00120 [Desulfovermiculus sp.]
MKTVLALFVGICVVGTVGLAWAGGVVIDPHTGQVYPKAGDGVVNPQTGQYYPDVGGGYVNPETGGFYPKIGGGGTLTNDPQRYQGKHHTPESYNYQHNYYFPGGTDRRYDPPPEYRYQPVRPPQTPDYDGMADALMRGLEAKRQIELERQRQAEREWKQDQRKFFRENQEILNDPDLFNLFKAQANAKIIDHNYDDVGNMALLEEAAQEAKAIYKDLTGTNK